ncbi:hypothetical protein E1281_39025 [Actinomadura sp. KC345]|uniref:hypothetical protein n=1 Tax=Actinomadura sp. KC345 TaxID=2530371 RepID=UPI00104ED723|nr:hypothetical protein [Actinomadura sp. KC345]TDC38731.1 hypothetical protein E1281_39025 [Actinomadura sp. KC345]
MNDQHVTALRSFLLDDYEVWSQKIENLIASDNAENYGILIHAAFTRAAYRKFSPSWSLPDVIRFVGEVRSSVGADAREIDALVAEKLLRQSIGDESVKADELAGVDVQTIATAESTLLLAMVHDADLDEVGVEEFIKDATMHANKWLAAREAE